MVETEQFLQVVTETIRQVRDEIGKVIVGHEDVVEGVLIAEVREGSNAWRHGLRPDDVVVGVNRKRVHDVEEMRAALADAKRMVALDLLRGSARLFVLIQ